MAEQGTKKSPNTVAKPRKKRWLAAALVLLPLLLIAGAVLGCRALHRVWFTGNERLLLRRVEISSTGFWNGREAELSRRLHLKPGTGLFEIDPAEVRRALENIPGISRARVYRELPDTLRIELVERVPRAIVGTRNSPIVADEDGVLMPRYESMAAATRLELPIITGVSLSGAHLGGKIPALAPALKLVMHTLQDFPVFHVVTVSLRPDGHMVCYLNYRNGDTCYRVVMPTENRDIGMLFRALEAAIIDVRRAGDKKRNFDLSYNGQVVVK